jgi:PAS domain S-box-containing protein
LRSQSDVVGAAFYDREGSLFVRYPTNASVSDFPPMPRNAGLRLEERSVIIVEPVIEQGKQVGMLYVRSSLESLYRRLRLYAAMSVLVLIGSTVVAFVLSARLQRRITHPILALANSAGLVSERGDYSIRAEKTSADELGVLTDAYNLMLARIQEQTLALRQREEQLTLTLEASRAGSWDWNLLSDRIVWDDYLHSLFGVKPGQFDGSYDHFLSLIHPDDCGKIRDAVSRAVEQKIPLAIEFRALWPDGTVHFLASRGRAFVDGHGKSARMIGLTFDISERKKAEQARSFLAAIVDSSDDAVVGKDLDGTIVSWNVGAERMFGYSEKEMLGQPVARIISPDHPGEETRVIEEVRKGQIRHFETVRVRKSGEPIEVSLTVSPVRSDDGQIIGISSIARDITERKRSAEALERNAAALREQAQLLDLANILARDLNDRIILWNAGMEEMYGWSKAEAVGADVKQLLRTEFPQTFEHIREKFLRDGDWEGELVHYRKDGRKIFVSSHWVLHRDARGGPAAILEVNTDVTERKLAEQEVLRINEELEHRVGQRTAELIVANHEMEAFTYSVAHDLRAPLRHIDAFARILREDFTGNLPEEARRYLENIRHGSRNMSRLVDDLLNLARVGRQELKRQPVALRGIVNEVMADLRNETESRQIDWRIHPLPSAECDPGLMKQVFANLLANAVKYTRPRSAAVIEIGTSKKNGATALFVRDNGVGFNMKYADKLFGVFQRLHRAEEFEGTGVGLATVDRIVRKHGGSVWAEGEVNKGATFYFTIPRVDS